MRGVSNKHCLLTFFITAAASQARLLYTLFFVFMVIPMINCVKIQNIHQEPKQTFDALKVDP